MSRFEEVPRKGKKGKEKSDPPNGKAPLPTKKKKKRNLRDLNKSDRLRIKIIQTNCRKRAHGKKEEKSREAAEALQEGERIFLNETNLIGAYRVKDNEVWLAKHAQVFERNRRFCILAFLSCRKKIGLSKDLMRYICSFLYPRCDLLIYSLHNDSMFGKMYHLNRKIPTVEILCDGKKEVDWNSSIAFDKEDEEIWVFNNGIRVFNMNEESWREVKNAELEMCFQGLGGMPFEIFWLNGMLVFCTADDIAIFSCDDSSRTLKRMNVPRFCALDLSFQVAAMGSFLFVWGVSSTCEDVPEYYFSCPCCDGFNYKRPRPSWCCSVLGVIDTNNLEHGWTYLLVPPVHYVPGSAKLVIDGGKLMIFGGKEKSYRKNPEKKIAGYYVLKLWEPTSGWKFRKHQIPHKFAVVRGKIIDLEQSFPNDFCDEKDRKKVVLIEYN